MGNNKTAGVLYFKGVTIYLKMIAIKQNFHCKVFDQNLFRGKTILLIKQIIFQDVAEV